MKQIIPRLAKKIARAGCNGVTGEIYRKAMISRYTYGLNGGDQFAYAFDARRGFPADADEAIRAARAGVRIDLDPGSGFLET